MSKKSKTSNKAFAAKHLKAAKAMAEKYGVILTFADGEWYGKGLEFPTAMGGGITPEECIANTREALVTGVACMLENGDTPPPAASSGKRTEQVNIRVTVEEKALLLAAARSQGFNGLGDFIRSRAMSR